ncbi:MAG TPA: hypothetical protein DHU96_01815 [Actinobacteria bacterium]|nr:hypothetical protein [Actinomycetota bacterium]
MSDPATHYYLPPSRALRWLREAGPRRRDTADAGLCRRRASKCRGPAPAARTTCHQRCAPPAAARPGSGPRWHPRAPRPGRRRQ